VTIKEANVLRALSFVLGLAVAASFSTMAGACGQLAPIEAKKPGHLIYVRGYGYGFEGGTRPIILVWEGTKVNAAEAAIDANGDFSVEITAPMIPGEYKLTAYEGLDDAAPVTVTVRVVGPSI